VLGFKFYAIGIKEYQQNKTAGGFKLENG
jgi:hypothetical protein